MRILILAAAFACFVFWSLLAWGASGLIGFASSSVPVDLRVATVPVAGWMDMLGMVGQGSILFVWAAGSIVLLLVTAAIIGILRRARLIRLEGRPRSHSFQSRYGQRRLPRMAPRLLRAMLN